MVELHRRFHVRVKSERRMYPEFAARRTEVIDLWSDEDDDDDFLSDSSVSDEENAQTEGADVHKVAAIVAS